MILLFAHFVKRGFGRRILHRVGSTKNIRILGLTADKKSSKIGLETHFTQYTKSE